jgi:signal transduction histidine kinase/CheY-like chemotaxis protein
MPKTKPKILTPTQIAKLQREAQVNDALDRIRSLTNAMQSTDDIGPVVAETRDVLITLGIKPHRTSIFVTDRANDLLLGWSSKSKGRFHHDQHVLSEKEKLGLVQKPPRKRWSVDRLNRRQVASTFRKFGLTKEKVEELTDETPLPFYHHHFYFSNGIIGVGMDRELDREEIVIARRVTETFGLAYKRFAELQEKEAQNRELTIQNALERVRAKAQGMQLSDEIAGVAKAIYDEFKGLGYDLLRINVHTMGPEDTRRAWSFSHYIQEFLGLTDEELLSRDPVASQGQSEFAKMVADARKCGEWYLIRESAGKELIRDRRELARRYGVKGASLKRWINLPWKKEVRHHVFHKNGAISFTLPQQLSEDDLLIAKRFTDVFDYAYDRFHELKEKEDQNRELTIQNAIERVRAQAQGMQASEELAGVAMTIYEELKGLGYAMDTASVIIREDDAPGPAYLWSFGERTKEVLQLSDEDLRSRAPHLYEMPGSLRKHLDDARSRGDWYASRKLEGQALRDARRDIGRKFGLTGSALRNYVNRLPEEDYRYHVFHTHGTINLNRTEPLADEDLLVAKRFTDVFDYAYDRFRELKEKEDQNRELMIQNALERVRARALGMQESGEVFGVAMAMFDEFEDLGLEPSQTSITVWDHVRDTVVTCDAGRMQREVYERTREELESRPFEFVSLSENLGRENYRAWGIDLQEVIDRQVEGLKHFSIPASGDDVMGLVERILEQRRQELGADAEWVATKMAQVRELFNRQQPDQHFAPFSSGTLRIVSTRAFDDEDLRTIRRFVDVFDFAHQRFLDLKQKEEQNRELTIQNALERVRARALGMQESAELKEVVSLLTREYHGLGIDIFAATIAVAREEEDLFENYVCSLKKNTGLLARSSLSETLRAFPILESWLDIEGSAASRVDAVSHEEHRKYGQLVGWTEAGMDALASGTELDHLYFGVAGFDRGYLGLVSYGSFSEDEMAVARRFAGGFVFAYSRFLELKEKEDQNRELTIQNALERVRAKAQGMQESFEIKGVSTAVRDEFVGLGYVVDAVGIYFPREDEGRFEVWFANPHTPEGTEIGPAGYMPIDRRIRGVKEMLAGERFVVGQMDREAFAGRIRRSLEALGTPKRKIDARVTLIPKTVYGSAINFGPGILHFATAEAFTDEELEVAGRFADVFGGAYARFNELKEKEEQNRELTIQNGLERVRARALGMQESHDLDEVSRALFEEIQVFGIDAAASAINVVDEENQQIVSSAQTDGRVWQSVTVPFEEVFELTMHKHAYEAWKRGDRDFRYVLRGKDRDAYLDFWIGRISERNPDWPTERPYQPDLLSGHSVFFHRGWITVNSSGEVPIPEDDLELLHRFGQVFDFAYGRFLELRQKEDQNRELTIQNALERVRARALGMQESAELGDVAHLLAQEYHGLGFDIHGANIVVVNEEYDLFDNYYSSPQSENSTLYRSSLRETHSAIPSLTEWLDVAKSGGMRDFEHSLAEWRRYGRLIDIGERTIEGIVSRTELDHMYLGVIGFSHGYLGLFGYTPHSEEDLATAKRFTEVFEFAYSRFLELKEKEDQNRELTIQNALERVRSRALGMQESDELEAVSRTLFEALGELDIFTTIAWVSTFDEEREEVSFAFEMERFKDLHRLTFPIEVLKQNDARAYEAWSRRSEQPYLIRRNPLEESQHIYTWTEIIRQKNPEYDPSGLDPDQPWNDLNVFTQRTGVGFGRQGELITDEEARVVQRFGEVFAFAYDRFLELKEKEDQNRELTIQNAIERVRSRALGMQESADVAEVTSSLLEELRGLELPIYTVLIGVYGGETIQGWQVGWRSGPVTFERDEELSAAAEAGKPWLVRDLGEVSDRRRNWVRETMEDAGSSPDEIEAAIAAFGDHQFGHSVFFNRGFIGHRGPRRLEEHELQILKRFTEVFAFAYDRFLELKQKEDQNRELTIQNAIERVRAQALGMQESSELNTVSLALSDGLVEVGFDVGFCYIVVVDEDQDRIDVSFQIPGVEFLGAHSSSLRAAIEGDAHVRNVFEVWKQKGDNFAYALPTSEWKAAVGHWIPTIQEINPSFVVPEDIQALERAVAHDGIFEHGWLGFTAAERIGDEDLDVLKRFSDVFGFAYNRFQELKQKEEQNRELTIQNAIERVRSRALGMQESSELDEVSVALFEALGELSFDTFWCAIGLIDEPGDRFAISAQVSGAEDLVQSAASLQASVEASVTSRTIVEAWRRKDKAYTLEVTGQALTDHLEFWTPVVQESNPGYQFPQAFAEAEKIYQFGSLFPHGLIEIGTPQAVGQEDQDVLRRFTEVFEFAYARFLELKEKEEQNRELTIQNAIERVRARALGMQASSELNEVSVALFDALDDVGIEKEAAVIDIADEEADEWHASIQLTGFPDLQTATRKISDMMARGKVLGSGQVEAWRRGEDFLERYVGDEWVELVTYWSDAITDMNPEFAQPDAYVEADGCWIFKAHHRYGGLGFTRFDPPIREEEIDVLKRFAQVFEFAYSRFLELKEKEDQNRELTIQNALERVRSRALGMQESSELDEVSVALFEALEDVGIDRRISWVGTFDHERQDVSMFFQVEGEELLHGSTTSLDDWEKNDPVAYANWRNDDRYTLRSWDRETFKFVANYWSGIVQETNPGYELPEMFTNATEYHDTIAWARHSFIGFGRFEPGTQEEAETFVRFSEVFDFAYSRFRELKESEEQAREADQRAAVDRVRAEATAMEKADDIAEVVTALWDGLIGQNIEFAFLTMEVIEREADVLQAYAAMPKQSPIQDRLDEGEREVRESRILRENILDGVDLLRSEVTLTEAIGVGFSTENLSRTWIDEGSSRAAFTEKVWGIKASDDRPVVFKTLRAGFGQGSLNLYVDPDAEIAEETVAFIEALGEAVSLGFARYWDFRELEAQNRELAIEGAVERVQNEAASMSETDDLVRVVAVMFRELETIGGDRLWLNIVFMDEATDQHINFLGLQNAKRLGYPEAFPETWALDDRTAALVLARSTFGEAREDMTQLWREQKEEIGMFQIDATADRMLGRFGADHVTEEARSIVEAEHHRIGLPFANGYIDLHQARPTTDDDVEVLGRFRDALALGFRRFLDMQQLEDQNRALEEANEQVREATRLKSQFLATMSHELRTPMNAIIGFTRLVTRRGSDNLTERQLGNLEKVQLSADHLLNLINEILDLSKVEAGRVDIEAADFELEPLLQGTCNTVGPTLGKAGVEVNCEVASDVGVIYSDEARLKQVVINLLSNALKFTDDGSVTLSAKRGAQSEGGEVLTISVVDTGIGIPENQLETIFEEFRQVDGSSTRRFQGTGLGLAITKKLVELLGGQIRVESTVGEGSTFTIEMPVRYGEAVSTTPDSRLPTPDVSEQSGERKAKSENGQSSRVIVSIDDDPNVAVLLRQELEDDGYTVISALNADEGVALVKKHQPAAVTVDILMPGKDGWETIKMLKDDPETRDVPVIVVSGMDNRDLGTAMGVKDYLVKPVDRDALLKALEKIGSDVKHVLVVDDEASARDLLVQILGDEGMESRTAVNGREALEAIERQVPDAILLDLMMPEVDGFEVVQRLQEKAEWKGIPVIVVTAKDLELEEKTFLSERVERVVQKGRLEPSELGRAIREAVQGQVTDGK